MVSQGIQGEKIEILTSISNVDIKQENSCNDVNYSNEQDILGRTNRLLPFDTAWARIGNDASNNSLLPR
jgi:hypothetical protein